MKGLVSIIIVNWNGLKWLKMCLPSLTRQKYKPVEIILVDNASADDSVDWTSRYYPKVRILKNKENLGFAEANNVGFAAAGGKYVLFLNNDTRVKPDFLTRAVDAIEQSDDIAGAQCKLLLMDDQTKLDAAGAFMTPTGFLFHWGFGHKDSKKYDDTKYLYTTKGAAMIFKMDVLKKVAMNGAIFDPTYFAYFEESDLCHRIWLSGKKLVYAPKSVIYHKMGGTSNGMDNTFIQYHSFKNRLQTYIKNLSLTSLLSLLPVHVLMCEFFSLASLMKGRVSLSWAIQRALWWNIWHLRDILHKRRYVQVQVRKVEDGEIFSFILKKPGLRYYMDLSSGRVSNQT